MTRLQRWIGCAVVALGAVSLCHPAAAQSSVALLIGSVITVDGLQMTVGSCTLTLLGASPADGCAAGHLQITALDGPGAGIKIEGDGSGSNGTNIFSLAQNLCGSPTSTCDDIKFTLNIVGVDPKTTVSSAAMTLAAVVGSSADDLRVSAGETVTSGGSQIGQFTINPNGAGNPAIVNGSASFSPVSSFSVSKDLHLNSSSTELLTLSYVTQLYTPAPEPVSIGIFLVGLAGLGAARRKAASRA